MYGKRTTKYLELDFDGKKIYIFKDHALALLCWKKAYDQHVLHKNATIFHIDQHPDFCFNASNREKAHKLLTMSDEGLKEFILHDLGPDNAEFIANAMYAGIIKDGICIHFTSGSDHGTSVPGHYASTPHQKFTSDEGVEHRFFMHNNQDLATLVGYQSLIGDSCIHQDTNDLFNRSEELLLDIDLDYFTYQNNGYYAKNPEDVRSQLESRSFKTIFDKSKVVTIALEPGCCGGVAQCLNIAKTFCEVIFASESQIVYEKIEEYLEENT